MKHGRRILLCCLLFSGWSGGFCSEPECNNLPEYITSSHFEKMTEGKISVRLTFPDAKEFNINIFSSSEGNDEKVFTIPLVSGNTLYPLNITPDVEHKLDIEFDLIYNYCKVLIDGDWLTSVLSKKQYEYVNGISAECSQCIDKGLILTKLQAEGIIHEKTKPLKIVAFGNSTTAYRKTITAVYSQRLPEYFKKQNLPVQVFNEGIGGSHTGHLKDNSLHKIRHALDRFNDAVLAKEPDFVTFNFGLNDSWVDSKDPAGESRIPVNKYRKNLLYMINALKNKNINVILLTPNAFGDKFESWRHKRTEKYVRAVRSVARKENLPLIDQWKIMTRLPHKKGPQLEDFLLPDEMHTNDLWHKISAETIADLIIDIINHPENNTNQKTINKPLTTEKRNNAENIR